MSFDPNVAANYTEPDAEIDDSDVDDKLMEAGSDICISDGGEMINLYDEKDEEPYVGMEFDSEESAMACYDAYAKCVGFIIRIGNCHRSTHNGPVVSRRFVCNKEGFRVNKKVNGVEVRKPRAITREGCKAMILVRKEKIGNWIIAKVETQHSHPLGISPGKEVRPRCPIRAQSQDEKDKRIRELSSELHRTKQKLAQCQKQLDVILNDVELHVDHLTGSVQHLVQNVKEAER